MGMVLRPAKAKRQVSGKGPAELLALPAEPVLAILPMPSNTAPPSFAQEVCARLPLAEAVLRLLELPLADNFLQGVFNRHRGRSYEKVIGFPTFVQLIADALLEHEGCGRQSFARAQEQGDLEASMSAAYGKLARVPLSLSRGLLFEASAQLQPLFPAAARTPLPKSLASMELLALDGKKIKHVARRLKVLRQMRGHILGGKLVVALSVNTRLALALDAHADGEVSDAPLVPEVLRQVRGRYPGPRLWLADRQFCDLIQPEQLSRDGDHYIIRYNAKVSFHVDPKRAPQEGTNDKGQRYVEEWGWIGKAMDKRRRYVRRITLYRPGEEAVILLTDLLDEEAYPAEDILAAYLLRWEIENCFQRITEVFALRRLIGGTPQATVYQAAFCLLIYNALMVVRGYVAQAEQRDAEEISLAEMFNDAHRQLIAWNEVLTAAETVTLLQKQTPEQLVLRLRQLAQRLWTDRWCKTSRTHKPPVKLPTEYPKGGHTSVFRLLERARIPKLAKRTG
jgi:IS4 transposase